MIHEEICTYEVCKLAKEKGFPQHPNENGKCRIYALDKSKNTYALCDWTVWISAPWTSKLIAAPTQSLLQRWLREEKGVFIEIRSDVSEKLGRITSRYNIVYDYDGQSSSVHICCDEYSTYELALEDALKYALENLVI